MAEAVKLWAAAALADDIDAEVEDAIALYNGDGMAARRGHRGPKIFLKAAKLGSPIAQDRYVRIMASGLGAPRHPVKAVKLHLVSRAAGETDITLDDFMAKPRRRHGGGRHETGAAVDRCAEQAQAAPATQTAAQPQPSPAALAQACYLLIASEAKQSSHQPRRNLTFWKIPVIVAGRPPGVWSENSTEG